MERSTALLGSPAFQLSALLFAIILLNWPFLAVLENLRPIVAYKLLLGFWGALVVLLFLIANACAKKGEGDV